MKFTAAASNLREALFALKKVIDKNRTETDILMSAMGDDVHLWATNGDTTVRVVLDAIVKAEGDAAIDVYSFEKVIIKINKAHGFATLEREPRPSKKSSVVKLTHPSTNTTFKFRNRLHKFFHDLPPDLEDEEPTFMNRYCGKMLQRVADFASEDDARRNLTCVHFKQTDEGLLLEATDGHQGAQVLLSAINMNRDRPDHEVNDLLVDAEGARITGYLADRAPTNASTITFRHSSDHASFAVDNYTVYSRVRSETFPDLSRVVPKIPSGSDEDALPSVDTERFKAAVEAVSSQCTSNHNKLVVDQGADAITITFSRDGLTCSKVEVPFSQGDSTTQQVRVDYRLLLKAIGFFDSLGRWSPVKLLISGGMDPILMWLEGDAGQRIITMPMRY